ncbi:MAG: hypothetical protein ABL973_19195 [Micropepsaceae bacterium]
MHGQKKRRKRTLGGTITIDGTALVWELTSEPQWSNSGDGYIGLCISVRVAEEARRELVIEYPFPTDAKGKRLHLPQRPPVSTAMVEASIRQAIGAGWDLTSRGKAFVFLAPKA